MNRLDFSTIFKKRTKQLALNVIRLYATLPKTDEIRIIGKQVMRSSTSVAANYHAVCRARSRRERFAKMCIVVEEADETLMWLEMLEESGLAKGLEAMKTETLEILKVMAKAKKTLRD